jgi:hypothetical protein
MQDSAAPPDRDQKTSVRPHDERAAGSTRREAMTDVMTSRPTGSVFAVALVLALAAACGAPTGDPAPTAGTVETRVHVVELEGYTLRANTMPGTSLSAEVAERYGIEHDAGVGLLNLVILEQRPDGQDVTVPAEISASQRDLLGHVETIEMRAIEANDDVSYIGTFDSAQQTHFRFAIEARPAGSDTTLTIEFEDRFQTHD